jgi:beta-lactamase regulating signal transducer with metallopeptidase domain
MIWSILINSKLIENLGWTLIHASWQISLIAFVLFLALRICKNFSANARYILAVAAFGFAFILPLATFLQLINESSQIRRADKITASENASSVKSLEPMPDNFVRSTNDNPETANLLSENRFFSLESFQKSLSQSITSLLPTFVSLWILGVGFFTFRLGNGVLHVRKYKTLGISEPCEDWQKRFSSLCEKLKIEQTVKLLQSNFIKTPIVVGWLKPLILVPTSVFLQMNPLELETILAHELAHIRRFDNLVNFAQSFVEILFFYHPCVWWMSAVVRREREFACDDAVVKMFENPHTVYASALANLEEIRQTAKENAPPKLSMAASGGKLMLRINRILEKNTERQNPKHTLWSAVGLALLLISAISTTLFWSDSRFDVNAQSKMKNKKMAIGFVSIPPLDRMENPPKDADATARLVIAKLAQYKIPAIGFVQGGMVSDGEKLYPVRANILRLWRDAGLEVGIGGYKHIWFYDTPYEDYVANTEKNEKVVKQILAEKNLPLRYFSYPFLNTGKTFEDKEKFENWLAARGLRSVKYTFDNQEWMYSFAYDQARKDNDVNTMNEVRAEFIDYMTKMLTHYEAYSSEMFGRAIAQTLVLTPSGLVADSADELFGTFEKRGYRFVSMDEAQADEAYRTSDDYDIPDEGTGKAGISWFERWQIAQGKKLRPEPRVSKSVEDTWNDRKDKNGPLPPKPPPPPITPPPVKMP